MRLHRVSHLVVSSVLASCGGEEGHRVVTIPPAPSASMTQVQPPPADVMDVVPIHPDAKMRFVSLGEIVEALVPPDPNRAALYAIDPAFDALQRINGPAVERQCPTALQSICVNPEKTRWIAIAKDSTVTQGTLESLDATRAHDAMIARASKELQNLKAAGLWFVDGESSEFPSSIALTAQTNVEPREDAMAIIAGLSQHLTRVRSLHGDERERAILAAGLPAKDRAVLRAVLVAPDEATAARVRPLARGWIIEMVTAFDGGCGSSSGYTRVVVLGSNAILDVHAAGRPRPCKGRRPPAWDFTASSAASSLDRFFEDTAAAEAASVDAFDLVARELESFGAPRELVDRARSAASDEVRHAELMSARAGIDPSHATRALRKRTPFEAALDNAVEGCVNESFAAVVARFQSRTAKGDDLAREFAAIADDECAHGDLAHDIAAWLEPRLTPAERSRVSSAREHAKRLLVAHAFEASGAIDDPLASDVLGLPSREQATALAEAFVASI